MSSKKLFPHFLFLISFLFCTSAWAFKKCPACDYQFNDEKTEYCQGCGHSFKSKLKCVACGYLNESQDEYCLNCTSRLDPAQVQSDTIVVEKKVVVKDSGGPANINQSGEGGRSSAEPDSETIKRMQTDLNTMQHGAGGDKPKPDMMELKKNGFLLHLHADWRISTMCRNGIWDDFTNSNTSRGKPVVIPRDAKIIILREETVTFDARDTAPVDVYYVKVLTKGIVNWDGTPFPTWDTQTGYTLKSNVNPAYVIEDKQPGNRVS